MKYACYTCGTLLGKGIPPLEALSKEQRSAVPGAMSEPGLILPAPFEGMSSYQFCEFCLLAIKQDPTAFERKGLREGEEFRNLGIVAPMSDEWDRRSLSDSVLANRFMIWRELNKEEMDDELLLIFLNYAEEVGDRQIALLEQQKIREEYEKTLRYKARRLYFRVRSRFHLPYHLDQGLKILWRTLTMSSNLDEEAQMDIHDGLAEVSLSWNYENDPTAPFARFELWALGKLNKRFFKLYG